MGNGEFNAGGNPAMDEYPIQGEVDILLVASCYKNRNKLRPYRPLSRLILTPVWWPRTANKKITYFCVINVSLTEV